MSPAPKNAQENDIGFDPDEDLFAFGDAASSVAPEPEEPEDLDEIFASFQEEEARARVLTAPAAALREAPAPHEHGATAASATPVASPAPTPVAEPTPRRATAAAVAPPVAQHTVERAAGQASPTHRAKILSGTSLLVLAAVVLVNALVAVVTLRTAADLQARLAGKAAQASAAEHAARPETSGSVTAEPTYDERGATEAELLPPDPEAHPVFEDVRQDLGRGDYAAARRRLYALLAVIDRLEPAARQDVEARAHYALARARHLEAVERMGRAR